MKKTMIHPMKNVILFGVSYAFLLSTASANIFGSSTPGIYKPSGTYNTEAATSQKEELPNDMATTDSSVVDPVASQSDDWRPDLTPLLTQNDAMPIEETQTAKEDIVKPAQTNENIIPVSAEIPADTVAPMPVSASRMATKFEGIASWYGPGFDNRKTANGEIYNQDAMTAAHKIFPMNTIVSVTNTENNKTVKLRINDRGPYKKGRIIDLSYAAAKELGFIDKGVAHVVVKVIQFPDSYSHAEGLDAYKKKVVQVGVLQNRDNAEKIKSQAMALTAENFYIREKQNLFYVQSSAFATTEDASQLSQSLSDQGMNNIVVSYKK